MITSERHALAPLVRRLSPAGSARPASLVGLGLAAVLVAWSGASAVAEETPAERDVAEAVRRGSAGHLGLGLPADCLAYVHTRGAERWGPLRRGFGGVVDRLQSAGVFDEILRTILQPSFADDEKGLDKKALEAEVAVWRAIFGGVEWDELLAREVAVGLRLRFLPVPGSFEARYYLLTLARVDPAKRAALSRGLEDLFEALAGLGRDLEVERRERDGIVTLAVRSESEPDAELCLGGLDDVIAISTSSALLRESLQLLRAQSGGWSLLVDDTFERTYGQGFARGSGDEPADLEVYVRPKHYFDQLRMLARLLATERGDSEAAVVAERLRRRLQSVIDSLDLIEWAGLRGRFEGEEAFAGDLRVVLNEGAAERGFYAALASQPPLEDVAGRVPKESTSFFAWSGVDVRALFQKFLALSSADTEQLKKVADAFEEFKATNEDVGALVRLAEHVEGSVVYWSLPSPNGGALDVVRLQVEDAAAAKKTLSDLVAQLRKREALELKEVDPAAGIYSIASPLDSGARLSFGLVGDDLVVVTAGGELALAAFEPPAGGDAGSIASRFAARRIPVDGPRYLLLDVSFERLLGRGREVLGVFALLGKLLSEGQRPTEAVPLASNLVARLGPALDALGFLDRKLVSIARDDRVFNGRWAVTFAEKKPVEKTETEDEAAQERAGEKKRF